MRRAWSLICCMFMLALAIWVLPAPVPAGAATIADQFDTLNASVWNPHYYLWNGSIYNPSTGTTGVNGGFISLRPGAFRGTSCLEASGAVVSTLPAHISFRVRYPGSGFRGVDIQMGSSAASGNFTMNLPYILWQLGKTNHNWDRNPCLDLVSAAGTTSPTTQPGVGTIIPTDTWLQGDMYLYSDHVRASFNGVDLTTNGDVASMVSAGGGLHLEFDTLDDGGQSGFDVDWVLVEQGTLTPATPMASADRYLAHENTMLTVPAPGVLANDTSSDSGTMTAALETPALHGLASVGPAGDFTYTPGPGFHGVDTFTYRTSRDDTHFATSAVTIYVLEPIDPPMRVVDDDFSALNPAKWQARFFGGTGTASSSGGALMLAPSSSAGHAAIESNLPIVTKLPAHVNFRLRLPGSADRNVYLGLTGEPASDTYGYYEPYVDWTLEKHGVPNSTWVGAVSATATPGYSRLTSTRLPRDTWVDCDLWLSAGSIDASAAGTFLHQDYDVESLLSEGGLYLSVGVDGSGGTSGIQLDRMLVDQQALQPGHIRGKVRNTAGAPLGGIVVGAWKEPEAEGESIALATQTVTAADGSYELTCTAPGWYAVAFDDPTDAYKDETFSRTGLPIEWGWAIPVDEAQEWTGVNAYLTSTSWLSTHRAIRVSGPSRYDTAISISQQNFSHADTVVLATGAGYADACAAAPLCGWYYAPLLLTTRYSLPGGVLPELQRLGAKDVFVVGSRSVVDDSVLKYLRDRGYTVTRISGADRYETAAAIVRYLMDQDVPLADPPFVVRGDNFPDALAVSPFAYAEVRPVLLVRPDSAPQATIDLLGDLGANELYVVGSPVAVGDGALQDLADGTGDLRAYRYWGKTRYETAAVVVRAWHDYWGYDNLGIATGADFPDALTGGIGQGQHWGGLLLSPSSALYGGASQIISENGQYLWPVQCYGGTKALSNTVLAQAASSAGSSFFEFESEYGSLGVLARSARRPLQQHRTGERPKGQPDLPASETYKQ